jgi:outer membrane protein assembly factor BamB
VTRLGLRARPARIVWVLAACCALALGCGVVRSGDFRGFDGTPKTSAGPALAVRWTLHLFTDIVGRSVPVEQASPAVDPRQRRVYVGSTRGTLWALDADDGTKLYGYPAGAAIEAQPTIDPERDEVYAINVRGTVFALRGSDGAVRWKAELESSVSKPAVLSEDTAYVVTDEDTVFALARKDGSVLFRYKREPVEGFAVAGHAGIAIADGTLVTAFGDGVVVALDASDGRVRWELDTAAEIEEGDPRRRFTDVDTTPSIADGSVYVASFNSGLYAIDLDEGTLRHHDPSLPGIIGVTATQDALILSSALRGVVCLDLPGLTPRWQYVPHHGAVGATHVEHGRVYVAESLGSLVGLSLADGQEQGRLQTRHGFTAPAMLDAHRGFALSNTGTIYAFVY